MTFAKGKLVLDLIGLDHNTEYSGQNNYLDTCMFIHCKSCNIEWCGNKMHQNVANTYDGVSIFTT